MNEQLISFETAKLAKEKGFDYKYGRNFYTNNGKFHHVSYGVNVDDNEYNAITQSLLQKWLREVHKIWIEVTFDPLVHYYYLQIVRWNEFPKSILKHKEQAEFDSYEEALEAGLIEALKLI